jgi:hypothetical protein
MARIKREEERDVGIMVSARGNFFEPGTQSLGVIKTHDASGRMEPAAKSFPYHVT